MNLNFSLLLGSKSPRRLQLLQEAGFDPEVVEISSEEVFPQLLPLLEVAKFLAEQKAKTYSGNLENKILLTADTIVIMGDRILGKPKKKIKMCQIIKTAFRSICLFQSGFKILMAIASNLSTNPSLSLCFLASGDISTG